MTIIVNANIRSERLQGDWPIQPFQRNALRALRAGPDGGGAGDGQSEQPR